jgi:hypothetical protein
MQLEQQYEGSLEYKNFEINYIVTWVRELRSSYARIESIDEVFVCDDGIEVEGYYDEHREEIENLIKADAKIPEFDEPSREDVREFYLENGYC